MASPKQPQSVTLLYTAEYQVRKVKNNVIKKNNQTINFGFQPIKRAKPNSISIKQMKIAKMSAYFFNP